MAITYKKLKIRNRDLKIKKKLQIAGKTKDEQKQIKNYHRKNKVVSIFIIIIFFICFILGVLSVKYLPLKSPNVFFKVLIVILKIVIIILSFTIASFLIYLISKLFPKNTVDLTYLKEELLKERRIYCQKYREFYGVPKDYILTTCYSCFDQKFNNKTVCLFKLDNKLCFTVDIIHGFINQKCDLGMYTIPKEKFKIERIKFNERNAYKIIIEDKEVVFAEKARKIIF